MPSPATAPGRSSRGLRSWASVLTRVVDSRSAAAEARSGAPHVHASEDRRWLASTRSRVAQRSSSDIRVNRDDAVAIPADQVEVLVVGDRVVRRRAVAEVRVPDQAELLEDLERAVDGGDVDRRGLLAHPRQHLVGGGVAEGVDRAQDQLALRGQPVALLPQRRPPVVGSSSGSRPLAAGAPRCGAAAPGPSPPCRRRRAGRPRRCRRAACRRRTPWRSRCGRPRRWRARACRPRRSPYQISTKPVLCVSTTSTLPSGRQRRKPVSMRGVADLLALSSTIQARRHVVEERAAVVGEDQLLAELERLDRRVVAVAVAPPGAEHPGHRAAVGVQVVGELERHGVDV